MVNLPTLSTSHFVNSHFVNSRFVNIDQMGIDKVGSWPNGNWQSGNNPFVAFLNIHCFHYFIFFLSTWGVINEGPGYEATSNRMVPALEYYVNGSQSEMGA